MPTRNRPENALIELFLSAYDNDTWHGCNKIWLDENQDRAVEVLATRLSDGATLAIEHTLIQPYPAHKQESAHFDKEFGAIRNDQGLVVRNRGVDVFVRSGTLAKGRDWRSIASDVHEWLRENVRGLPVGESTRTVAIHGTSRCELLIRVVEEQDFDGDFRLGIDGSQLSGDTLSSVVEKALKTKIGKLADTKADKRILLLERDEVTLKEAMVAAEIERIRHTIEKFDQIHEVWFAENVHAFGNSNYVQFNLWNKGRIEKLLAFHKGRLRRRYGS